MTAETVSIALSGFVLGFSLILAIGAQNAFVLRQGLLRAHVFPVALTCALSDAALITAGVLGFGHLVESAPWIGPVLTWAGAAFLIVYGAFSFMRAWRGGEALEPGAGNGSGLWPTLLTCLALTWGNPHVYLDTVVLLGSVAQTHGNAARVFGAGAVIASFVFFFALAYGARLLAPVFRRPGAWRVLELGIGILMWALAGMLILS